MDKTKKSKSKLSRFFSYYKPHRRLFAIDLTCAFLVAVIDIIFPYATRLSMQTYLPNGLYKSFFIMMAVLFLAYVLKAVLNYFITVLGHKMGVLIEADMRRDLFGHIQRLSFSFFDKNRTGEIMSRITNDLFEITELAHHGPEDVLICAATLIGSLAVMLSLQFKLAMCLILFLPVSLALTMSQRRRVMRASAEVKKRTGEINATIESGISGVRTARAFANEQAEVEKFEIANAKFKNAKTGFFKSFGIFMSGMSFTTSAMQVLVVTVGGYLIMQGELSVIDLLTFTLYVGIFIAPIRKLVNFSELFYTATRGFDRFLEILDTKPEIEDAPDATELSDVKGEIEFKNVGFKYKGTNVDVLKNVSLKISAGEKIAVVGPSGGGKTTLCQLVPRFYDVTEGAVLVDGHDVRSVTQDSLRRSIGIIQQEVFLFAASIRENIRYGRPDATDAEVVAAACMAEMHADIMEMEDGYDTQVGERGIRLSGGQKQRVAIARVLLKNPPILILDEATSALDTVTELKIQSALDELSRNRTAIIIAHRLSTVYDADRIAVIENEEIAEIGTHAELIKLGGIYAKLYNTQGILGPKEENHAVYDT